MGLTIFKPTFPKEYRLVSPLLIALIMSLVFVFYFPTIKNDFIWDDEYNFIDNLNYRGLSLQHVAWMFTNFHDGNYHPLCWLSLGIDFTLWGMNPGGYHLTDLVLHGTNTVLLFLVTAAILRRLSVNPNGQYVAIQAGAAVGALFFALHPLRVESVAWVSTRGDTLCGVFYLLTLLAYFRIDDDKSSLTGNRWLWLSLFFFACSLLSRAWGITLPVILLILDIYPLKRVQFHELTVNKGRRILIEKVPFALLAFGFGTMALLAKQASMVVVAQHGILERILQAFYGLGFYFWKTLIPSGLSPLYALHGFDGTDPKTVMVALAAIGMTTGLFLLRRSGPWAFTAWICYAVIVSPLLGFAQSGPQLVADRYTYFACLPFAVLVGGGITRLWLLPRDKRAAQLLRTAGLTGTAGIILFLGSLSSRQLDVWYSPLSFWDRIISLDGKNLIAINERARLKLEVLGDFAGAVDDYSQALRLEPDNAEVLINRGLARLRIEQYKRAELDFNAAQRLEKNQPEVYNGRGLIYHQQGLFSKALQQYNAAIRLSPKFVDTYNNRGLLHFKMGNSQAAIEDFKTAIRLSPRAPEAYANRGQVRLAQKKPEQAVRDFETALQLAPENWPFRLPVTEKLQQIYARHRLDPN